MAITRNVFSLLLTVMFAMAVKGMFFTDSKENDYPRIGKRCRTSSKFYNSVLCRNIKPDEYPKDNSMINRQDLLTPYNDNIYGTFNQDVDGLDSTEDIYRPADARPYKPHQSQMDRVLDRVRQYLRNARIEFESA